ncbi:hypothetical protein A9762_07375 [Pandoraea sp. ISTKB]|nr:hypothetical protein A9762_07375 [Pandoraea sp. ISTKB]
MESPQIESVAQMLDHRAPHVGVLFLYLWQIISKKHKQIVSRFIRVGVYRNGLAALLASIARLPDIDELSQSSESDGSPADENLAGISIRSRPLKSLKIVGFKGIDSIDIEFPIASESAGGALAIVGQNAAGKSTILQALGLALIGPEEANKVVKDARIFLPDGRQRSSVRVTFWGDDRSNQIDIIRESPRFGGVAELPVRVYGYGPYRLLAQRPLKKSKRGIRYRLASLFDDGERLNGYHGWLDNLSDAKRRDLAEILELLITSPGTDVRVSPANLEITTNGRPHPLHALSSGMQSVVSMCTDLAEALYATGDSALATNCVILVDELDAHLHPAWRMGIVKRLNRAFPNAQLVFSTHDPLSLRGLSADQVQILYRDANGAANAKRADRYSDALDVDQILTSEIFGLFNTHAPDWEPTFKSYYDLLAKEDSAGPLLPQERAQLDALRVELQALGVLGKTRRERLMYGVIDRLLAQQTGTIDEWDPATIKKLASDVQNKIDEQPVSGRDEGRGQ